MDGRIGGSLLLRRLAALALGCAFSLLCLELSVRGAAWASRSRQDRANRAALVRSGVVRILCIGESTTAGLGLAPEDSYPFQLGEILNARGRPVSVVNAGRSGADSTFLLWELEDNLERYRPDIVVAMMGINDRRDMAPADSLSAGGTAWPRLRSLRLIPLLREALARERGEASAPDGRYLAIDLWDPGLYLRAKEARWYTDISSARAEGRHADMESAARQALAAHPGIFAVRLFLAEALREEGRAREAEGVLRADPAVEGPGAAVALRPGEPSDGEALLAGVSLGLVSDPRADRALIAQEYVRKQLEQLRLARFQLLQSYLRRGALQAAGALRAKMRSLYPRDFSGPPRPFLPAAQNFPAAPGGIRPEDLPALFPGTARNFSRLKQVLDRRGVRLVCVQYPRRDVRLMKALLADRRGVVFVDNAALFDAPLRTGRYGEWFIDSCYEDFGHGSRKGNRLLAQSVADALAREVLPRTGS
ncbi:MAG: hypothetical protein HY926_08235 [Elusimicrobia bacterium]|nr:hypothetical protein [Elusimicrobiota bacterium]